ncbi:flagellar protein [Paenibacillus sp. CAA11]|uniref:TIGR03826 family flagellar region protein n=1 Tax=Paenibacillus sp. CAA11 TaxID=1532905 RepID=UPI000D3748B8|nr:TIGR03826 family flagellar region protein [Paenibacillus sp. CAA11]AWB46240.1 flagellar protein [Paenibacillus sp. CAA11]
MNLDNCPRCGKLYAKNFKELCGNCIKDIELEYEKCKKYLRDQKGATIVELSEATEVSVKQITKFIKEGRISIANNPNMMYPCEVCGVLIREGTMCDGCRTRLTRELLAASQEDDGHRKKDASSNTYGAVDKFRRD